MSLALISLAFPKLRLGSDLATIVGCPFLEKANLKEGTNTFIELCTHSNKSLKLQPLQHDSFCLWTNKQQCVGLLSFCFCSQHTKLRLSGDLCTPHMHELTPENSPAVMHDRVEVIWSPQVVSISLLKVVLSSCAGSTDKYYDQIHKNNAFK